MKSIYNGHGYLMHDDRNSGGKLREDDVLGCGHCQCTIAKRNWKAYGEHRCSSCDEPVCSICAFRIGQYGCENFKRFVDRTIDQRARAMQKAKIIGL
jgi:hypothetical protein